MKSEIPTPFEQLKFKTLEIKVTSSLEEAINRFRVSVQKEGILNDYKESRRYQKPSVAKKIKSQKAQYRRNLEAKKEKMIMSGEWNDKQKKKEAKKHKVNISTVKKVESNES